MNADLLIGCLLFFGLHGLVWLTTNLQFIGPEWVARSLPAAVILSIPTTLVAYYATRYTHSGLDGTVWGTRFVGFSTSWLVFPVMTWALLGESPFEPKTLLCTALSVAIVLIQMLWTSPT